MIAKIGLPTTLGCLEVIITVVLRAGERFQDYAKYCTHSLASGRLGRGGSRHLYREEKEGPEKLSNLLEITEPGVKLH